jgi:metal transporter CNNM
MNQQLNSSLRGKLVLGMCMAASAVGLPTSSRGEELEGPHKTVVTSAERSSGIDHEELKPPSLPPFRPVDLTPETSSALTSHPELRELIESVEPRLRGEKVVLAVVDPHGNVVGAKELAFPEQQNENTILLWGLFASGLLASATLSGLTIGLFSVSKLQLTLLSEQGCEDAKKILGLREDANTVLSTLIWGNVGLNVLISKVGDQALSTSLGAVGAAIFSIGAITLFGEILPQAYFTQNVLKAGSRLEPVVKALRVLLYPVAKPSGMVMDRLVGREGLDFFKEQDLTTLLNLSARLNPAETSAVEAQGAANFLDLDDLSVAEEGEVVCPQSILHLPVKDDGSLDIPNFTPSPEDPFLQSIQVAKQKWVVLCDSEGNPRKVLDADSFLRDVLFQPEYTAVQNYWHKPLVVRDGSTTLGEVLPKLSVEPDHHEDDVIDRDIILVWAHDQKRIITGSDLLGRLMRGIARLNPVVGPPPPPTLD